MARIVFSNGSSTELYFNENGNGSVTVGSEDWELITFNPDGTFTKEGDISLEFSYEKFSITKKGKIRESKV